MNLLTSAAVVVVVVEPVIALAFVARRAAGRRRRDDRDGERDETVGTVCALRKACVRMALAVILMVDG